MLKVMLAGALLVAVSAAPAAAQQTDADRMAIMEREAPAIVHGGAIAVMAAACGLRPPDYKLDGPLAQTVAGNTLVSNLWGVSGEALLKGVPERARKWLLAQFKAADEKALSPTADECSQLEDDPQLLAGIDNIIKSIGQ